MFRYKILILAVLLFFSGCIHVSGKVLDVDGRVVPGALVRAEGFYHGGLFGEGDFSVAGIADSDGEFKIKVPEEPQNITATSPDGARKGVNDSPERFHENIIIIK